jgi:hypothetical protein
VAKKDNLVKVEFYLTKENAEIVKNIDTRMITPSFYINSVIETTSSMKKFKDLRIENEKNSVSAQKSEDEQSS